MLGWLRSSGKEFHLREAGAAGSDRQNVFGLVEGGFKPGRGGVFSFEETGSDLLHQGFELLSSTITSLDLYKSCLLLSTLSTVRSLVSG